MSAGSTLDDGDDPFLAALMFYLKSTNLLLFCFFHQGVYKIKYVLCHLVLKH